MRTTFSLTVLLVGFLGSGVRAAEPSVEDLINRIDTLEAELSQQQAEFRAFRQAVGEPGYECGARSFYADYELTILQPIFSDNVFGPGFDESMGAGHRFTLGIENHRGYGARLRYWMYDHTLDGFGANAGDQLHIDMDSLDIDLTLREKFRRWDLLLSGGARYGRTSYGSDTIFPPGEARFEGFGPTCSLEVDRAIGCRGFHLIGNVRGSLLFGDVDFFGFLVEDELTTVLENQLGIGWQRQVGRAMLDIRAVWESQVWLNNAFADALFGFGSNQGFTGPTVAAELRF